MPSTAAEPRARPHAAGRDPIEVVAGAIVDPGRGVLLALRRADAHQGGLWEFPGGKRLPGEGREQALARELAEELGIRPLAARPLIALRHDYPDRSVVLDVWRVDRYDGEPRGLEGQPLRWCPLEELPQVAMPAADRPIVNALRLPDRCLVTGDAESEADFLDRLGRALARGPRLVQLRSRRFTGKAYLRLAERSLALCRERGAALVLNADPGVLARVPADGVHLAAARLRAARARPVDHGRILSVACHGAGELALAEALEADLALLSPVLPTASHPGAAPLGWGRFAELVGLRALPVYALGGVCDADLADAWAHGGQGIAAIRCWWDEGTRP